MIPRHVQITIVMLLVGVLGGALFLLHLKQRAELAPTPADNRPLSAPVSGPNTGVRLLIAYDDDGVVRDRDLTMPLPADPGPRAREILRALFAGYAQRPSPHPIADGSDVREVYMLKDGTCVVDLNSKFADGHRSGVLLEQLSIFSMVESIADNVPQVQRVRFLVEGAERDTLAGHADLRAVYEVAAVRQAVAGLR